MRHLQTYLKDEKLGLIKVDPENGEPIVDRATGRVIAIEPKDAANVYVAVSASKSKHYYVQGAVAVPGRVPVTGMETVLDAIQVAGGLAPDADPNQVFLYRPDAGAAPAQQLKIDVDQITMGDDLSTNYQLLPGDRLVVRRQEDPFKADGPEPTASEAIAPETPVAGEHSGRRQMTDDSLPEESTKRLAETVQQIDKRLAEVERKLDVILRAVTSARALSDGADRETAGWLQSTACRASRSNRIDPTELPVGVQRIAPGSFFLDDPSVHWSPWV